MAVLGALVATLVATMAAAAGSLALTSCIAPPPISELAERTDAVVYARVLGFEGSPGPVPSRLAFVQVERVLKGGVPARISVGIGPGTESGPSPGGPAAASVDYDMERGTDHTLYLEQRAPAGFTTNACSGSHAGPPNAEEERFFGPGNAPDPVAGGAGSATGEARIIAAAVTAIAILAGIGAVVYARRSARTTASI